ncbi:MAG: hypothetical protein NTX86_00550 [Candidatus Dependentiae bacterium]|nr:hypothetical protein [Candidatus Dependentiae bacterium]
MKKRVVCFLIYTALMSNYAVVSGRSCADRCDATTDDGGNIMLGKDYYFSLLDKAVKRHWAVPILFNYSIVNEVFGDDCQPTGIADGAFGGRVRLRDIYLISRLSEDNKVFFDKNAPRPLSEVRDATLTGNTPWGDVAQDLYLTLIAPLEFGFNVQKQEAGCNMIREVFDKKGIKFAGRQVNIGFGDVSIFGLLDLGGLWKHTDGLQFGVTVVFPTGKQVCQETLFAPNLGDGVYKIEPFFNAVFNTPSTVFNPTVKLVGSFSRQRSTGNSGGTRIGKFTSSNSAGRVELKNVPGLNFPETGDSGRFGKYWVESFSEEVDSIIPEFADTAVPACIKPGARFLFGIGNYFYDIFAYGFRLGLFYDYSFKRKDCVTVDPCYGTFDICAVTANTSEKSHSLGANLTYKFRNMLELNVGTQNVIGGRNVPRLHEFFASIIAVF